MGQKEYIKLFEQKKVRSVWDDEKEEWFFSIVDVCGVLTDQPDYDHARNYWKVLKHRLIKEGNETVTNCNQLKMMANDGKKRLTDMKSKPVVWKFNLQNPSQWFGNLTYQLKNPNQWFGNLETIENRNQWSRNQRN